MPREVTRFAGSSAALIRAATGLLSARYIPVNVCMQSAANPAPPQGTRGAHRRGFVLVMNCGEHDLG
jgi:cellulase/cellobiase CelA1